MIYENYWAQVYATICESQGYFKTFPFKISIFQVNLSSLSEAAGLQAGDLLLAVNGADVQNCKHKEAQDTIVRAGNNFEITVQRLVCTVFCLCVLHAAGVLQTK